MKIENQVCTVEQAEKLFELGVDLDSQFAWCWNGRYYNRDGSKGFFINQEGFKKEWEEAYCAFTVSELGVMLPNGNQLKRTPNIAQFKSFRVIPKYQEEGKKWLCSADVSNLHHVTIDGIDAHEVWKIIYGDTEAQARAAMLIYLLEHNHITADEVNERLLNA